MKLTEFPNVAWDEVRAWGEARGFLIFGDFPMIVTVQDGMRGVQILSIR